MEAARSLRMPHAQAMRRIILPQTFRRVVRPTTNEAIALLNDSSLVSIIGLTELARTGQQLASTYSCTLKISFPVSKRYSHVLNGCLGDELIIFLIDTCRWN